ncbi:hypothetical protein BJX76DRAFT_352331 [Aspergillus varians]
MDLEAPMRQSSPDNPLQDHALPSVEFTFSYSPSSTGRLTPTSSIDDSVDHGVNQRSTTPTTQSLFQNLQLGEDQRPATSESESPSSNDQRASGLTPRTRQTTYRDLYNATPVPEGAPSTEPQRQPEAPASPLDTVTLHVQNLNLAESRDATAEDSDRDSNPGSFHDDDDNDHLYNFREEELPQAPIYDIRLQDALRNVRGQLASLAQFMRGRNLVQDPTSALHGLYKQTLGDSQFAYPSTRTVGFIGDSGAGKSSLINSILNADGLARSSGDGAACTTVVTEFRNVDEQYPDNYTVKADFMDNAEIRELLEELLWNVRKYYTDAYREVTQPGEQEKIRTAATRAWDTLRSLFPNQPELGLDFLSRDGEDAAESIASTLEEWAITGLNNQPGGRDALEVPRVGRHADECMELLDNLMVDPRDGETTAVWPFVKLIRVYLRSPILRTGLVLADLPGFRDLNYARVRATERYLRHSCDELVIVSMITRAITDQSIADIIRHRCRPRQPIQIAFTRSEDVDPVETARGASAADATQIRNLDGQIQDLDRKIRQTRSSRRQSTGRTSQELASEETSLGDQKEAAELELKRFLISRRNRWVTDAFTGAWRDQIRGVFCVSNKLYSDYREEDLDQANAYLELSGIRQIRRHCQSVPADAQLRATELFLQDRVPALLNSLSTWAAAGSDTVTQTRAAVLRGILDEAEQTLKRTITSHGSKVILFRESVERQFRHLIRQTIRNSRSDWRDDAVAASRDWACWHHTTYKAFCNNYGTHETGKQARRCWNAEILGLGSTQLSEQWDTMLDLLEEQKDDLEEEVSRVFRDICDSIQEHHDIAPDSMRNLLPNLVTRRRCIIHAIDSTLEDLLDATDNIKLDAIGGHDSSFIASVMRPVYNSCREQYGTGSDARRKRTMNRHLTTSPLFKEFSSLIAADHGELVERTFNVLDQKLREEVASITRDLRASVTVNGEISEAAEDPGHTEEVKRRIGFIREALGQAQRVVRGVGRG